MTRRRVVTGHDESGRAVFVGDDAVSPIEVMLQTGSPMYRLWGGDETPSFPDDGSAPSAPAFFPSVDGFRFGIFTVAAASDTVSMPTDPKDVETAFAEMEAALPGMLGHMDPDDPGMHTTDTIDFEVVLAGEVVLELDDGATRTLAAGDTVVQNGTRHRWRNEGSEPAVLAFFMVGARRTRT